MPTPEGDVLKPIDPSITDSNEWESFILSHAHVVYESNGRPASLLSAYADTPLRVQGRLEPPDRRQLKYRTLAASAFMTLHGRIGHDIFGGRLTRS